MRSLAIVITIVQSFSPLIFFSPSFAFDPLRGNSHVRNNFSPNILALLEDKYFLGVNFIFLRKKGDFSDVFSDFYGQRSVTAAWGTRSPWSIFSLVI